jgi:hypothetical protein
MNHPIICPHCGAVIGFLVSGTVLMIYRFFRH